MAGDTGRFKALSQDLADDIKTAMSAALVDHTSQLKAEIHRDNLAIRTLLTEQTTVNLSAHEATRKQAAVTQRQVVQLTSMTYTLWADIRGDQPPPSPPDLGDDVPFDSAAKKVLPPVGATISGKVVAAETDIHTLAEEVHALRTQQVAIRAEQNEQKIRTTELLSLQKEQMGKKDERGKTVFERLVNEITWLARTRDGRRYTATLIAGLTGLVTVVSMLYALITGRPLPTLPLPQQQPTPALHP